MAPIIERITHVKVRMHSLARPSSSMYSLRLPQQTNRRLERAHANIWSFIRCIVSEETRFQHVFVQLQTGSQRRPKATSSDLIQKRVNTLNERYTNQEIDAEELLDGLSFLIAKKK